ncbi:MAG: thiamine-monophosphate kinase [Planctomycetota bacterium]
MGGERAFTDRLGAWFGSPPGARVPIGDDAAVVRNRGRESVLCCDPVIAGVHFEPGTDLRLVGRKAVNRNLADLAAMGAVPDWLLVSLLLPQGTPPLARRRLLLGLRAAARAGGCAVVGGDVAATPGPLTVTVTAIGHLPGQALRRSGARAGDSLHVTGPLGASRLGHHLTFQPPLAAGRWLARPGMPVGAAIDVSDGLLLDLWTVLRASGGLGAELFADAVPVRSAARRAARGDRQQALRSAFGDGEDHELLFTVRRGRALPAGGPLAARVRRPIGRVIATPGLWLVDGATRRRLRPVGHEHDLAAS